MRPGLHKSKALLENRTSATHLKIVGKGAALALLAITALAQSGRHAANTIASPGATASSPVGAKTTIAKARKRHHWFELGTASWSGLKFQGHQTATGEKFDSAGLTCAHRSLPLGSWIRVTNLHNRKSVMVRVNDRGPVSDDRVIDLSYAAARAVGIGGTARVGLETVSASDVNAARMQIAKLKSPVLVRMN